MNFVDWLVKSGVVFTADDGRLEQVDKNSPRDKILLGRWLARDADPEEEHWITTKNNHRVLLDEEGEIQAGMGGAFNGQKINKIPKVGGTPVKPTGMKFANPDAIKAQIKDLSEGYSLPDDEQDEFFHEQNTLRAELQESEWSKEYAKDKPGQSFTDKSDTPDENTLKSSLPQKWGADHGQEFIHAVVNYTGGDWDEWKYDSTIDYGIRNSTLRWDKGDLARGVRLHPEELAALKVGGYYVGKGLESWSSSMDVAKSFTEGCKEDQSRVVLIDKTKGVRNAVPIAGISFEPQEKEVLYAMNQGFKIRAMKKEKVDIRGKEREVTFVELESL